MLDRASRAIRSGARFIATNDDATYPTPTGPLPAAARSSPQSPPRRGSLRRSPASRTAPMAELVRARCGPTFSAGRALMVGDRWTTDGLFADVLGCPFALVRSGVTAPGAEAGGVADIDEADLAGVAERSSKAEFRRRIGCGHGKVHDPEVPRCRHAVHRDVEEAGRGAGEVARQGRRGAPQGRRGSDPGAARARQGGHRQDQRDDRGRGGQAGRLAKARFDEVEGRLDALANQVKSAAGRGDQAAATPAKQAPAKKARPRRLPAKKAPAKKAAAKKSPAKKAAAKKARPRRRLRRRPVGSSGVRKVSTTRTS